eukprot:2784084-Rhodomonas_salina.4
MPGYTFARSLVPVCAWSVPNSAHSVRFDSNWFFYLCCVADVAEARVTVNSRVNQLPDVPGQSATNYNVSFHSTGVP